MQASRAHGPYRPSATRRSSVATSASAATIFEIPGAPFLHGALAARPRRRRRGGNRRGWFLHFSSRRESGVGRSTNMEKAARRRLAFLVFAIGERERERGRVVAKFAPLKDSDLENQTAVSTLKSDICQMSPPPKKRTCLNEISPIFSLGKKPLGSSSNINQGTRRH